MKTFAVFCPRTPRTKNRNLCWGVACSDSSVITIASLIALPAFCGCACGEKPTRPIDNCHHRLLREPVRAAAMLWSRLVS